MAVFDLNGNEISHGIPAGGTAGQVLMKGSSTDYDASWQDGGGGGGGGVSPYTGNPSALGTASPGSSANYARGDHVHPMPSAANVGAIEAPSSPTAGAFLMWSGTAWVAQTYTEWQGGSY